MQQVLSQLEQLNASGQHRPSRDALSETLHQLLQRGGKSAGDYDPFLSRYGQANNGESVEGDGSSDEEKTNQKDLENSGGSSVKANDTGLPVGVDNSRTENDSLNIVYDEKNADKHINNAARSEYHFQSMHEDARGNKGANYSMKLKGGYSRASGEAEQPVNFFSLSTSVVLHPQTPVTNSSEEGSADSLKRRLLALSCPRPLTGPRLLSLVRAACTASHADVTRAVADQLYSHFSLARHVSCLCSVMLLKPTNVMSGFTSAVFNKCFAKQKLNAMDLTLELHECLEKLFPDLVEHFTVVVVKQQAQQTTVKERNAESVIEQPDTDEEERPSDEVLVDESSRTTDDALVDGVGCRAVGGEVDIGSLLSEELWDTLSLKDLDQFETQDLADLRIRYQVGWPLDCLLPAVQLEQYNAVLQFCLRLQQALHALNALNFKDMGGWELVQAECLVTTRPGDGGEGGGPAAECSLRWRLHRLQLLRHWLLYFCRTVHDHFTTCVIMPFCNALNDMLERKPPLHEFIAEHERLVSELSQQCLLGTGVRESPVQLAFKKVVGVVSEVCDAWRCGGCGATQLSTLESSYAACHRFLLRLLRVLAGTDGAAARAHRHLSGLIDALASSCPVNV